MCCRLHGVRVAQHPPQAAPAPTFSKQIIPNPSLKCGQGYRIDLPPSSHQPKVVACHVQMWTSILPIDVAKTRLQTASPGSPWDVGVARHLQMVRFCPQASARLPNTSTDAPMFT
eukprot:365402-Chlamydomonas_euryale.AAC.9